MLLAVFSTYRPSNLEEKSDYCKLICLSSIIRPPLQRLTQNFAFRDLFKTYKMERVSHLTA